MKSDLVLIGWQAECRLPQDGDGHTWGGYNNKNTLQYNAMQYDNANTTFVKLQIFNLLNFVRDVDSTLVNNKGVVYSVKQIEK